MVTQNRVEHRLLIARIHPLILAQVAMLRLQPTKISLGTAELTEHEQTFDSGQSPRAARGRSVHRPRHWASKRSSQAAAVTTQQTYVHSPVRRPPMPNDMSSFSPSLGYAQPAATSGDETSLALPNNTGNPQSPFISSESLSASDSTSTHTGDRNDPSDFRTRGCHQGQLMTGREASEGNGPEAWLMVRGASQASRTAQAHHDALPVLQMSSAIDELGSRGRGRIRSPKTMRRSFSTTPSAVTVRYDALIRTPGTRHHLITSLRRVAMSNRVKRVGHGSVAICPQCACLLASARGGNAGHRSSRRALRKHRRATAATSSPAPTVSSLLCELSAFMAVLKKGNHRPASVWLQNIGSGRQTRNMCC